MSRTLYISFIHKDRLYRSLSSLANNLSAEVLLLINFCFLILIFSSDQCVDKALLCDGIEDCINGSDEDEIFCQDHKENTKNSCDVIKRSGKIDDFFRCDVSKQCISLNKVCDFRLDCRDGLVGS